MDNTEKKKDFYYTVHSFMTGELGLKGSALVVYAIIYAFSRDGEGYYYGTLDFLCENTGLGLSSVKNALRSLVNDGLLICEAENKFGRKHFKTNFAKLGEGHINSLSAKRNAQKSASQGTVVRESNSNSRGGIFYIDKSQNSTDGQPNSTPNNKYNNKYINNSYNSAGAHKGAYAQREKEENKRFKKEKDSFDSVPYFDNSDSVAIHEYLAKFIPKGEEGYAEDTPKPKCKYGNFDPDEAFRIALERSEEAFRERATAEGRNS